MGAIALKYYLLLNKVRRGLVSKPLRAFLLTIGGGLLLTYSIAIGEDRYCGTSDFSIGWYAGTCHEPWQFALTVVGLGFGALLLIQISILAAAHVETSGGISPLEPASKIDVFPWSSEPPINAFASNRILLNVLARTFGFTSFFSLLGSIVLFGARGGIFGFGFAHLLFFFGLLLAILAHFAEKGGGAIARQEAALRERSGILSTRPDFVPARGNR